MSRPRFVVASVTGYSSAVRMSGEPQTDYMVLDRDFCHRVVASFPAPATGRPPRWSRQAKAEQLADSLNRGDQARRDALARDAEQTA